eukprot:scaffold1285_cov112-Isochrysis_galbana.AAC.1
MCVEQIQAFKKCHEETGYIGKALGACNQPKALMDRCFREQKKVKRRINREDRPSTAGAGAPGRGAWKKMLEEGAVEGSGSSAAGG